MLKYPLSIAFGADGDYLGFAGAGWNHDANDKGHTWTQHVAELQLPLPRSKTPIRIEFDLIPKGGDQDVFCFVNGGFAAFWRVNRAEKVEGAIHPNLLRPGENTIVLTCPRAVRPQDEGAQGDQRILGVAVRSVCLFESGT